MSKEDVLLFGTYGMRGTGKSYYEKLKEKDKEIERLNNIINEIEGCIEHIISESYFVNENIDTSKFGYLLNKIKELKGVDKE